MEKRPDHNEDDTLLIALEQLGKGLDMLQSLFIRIESYVTAREADDGHSGHPRLTPEIPAKRTIH